MRSIDKLKSKLPLYFAKFHIYSYQFVIRSSESRHSFFYICILLFIFSYTGEWFFFSRCIGLTFDCQRSETVPSRGQQLFFMVHLLLMSLFQIDMIQIFLHDALSVRSSYYDHKHLLRIDNLSLLNMFYRSFIEFEESF